MTTNTKAARRGWPSIASNPTRQRSSTGAGIRLDSSLLDRWLQHLNRPERDWDDDNDWRTCSLTWRPFEPTRFPFPSRIGTTHTRPRRVQRRQVPSDLRVALRRLQPYSRRYRRSLVVLGLFRVLIPIAEVAAIWVFKIAVDQVFIPASLDRAPFVLGLLLLSGLVVSLLSFAESLLSQRVAGRLVLDARADLMRHMLSLRPDFYDQHSLGDLLSRISNDVSSFETLVVSISREFYGQVLRAAVLLCVIFALSWRLALAGVIVVPLFALISRYFAKKTKLNSRHRRRLAGEVGATAEDVLANVPLIQAHNTLEQELGRFAASGSRLYAADVAATRLKAWYQPAVDGVELLGAFSVVAIGTVELAAGRMTLGALFVFMAFLNQLFSPIRALGRLSTTLASATASAERVFELLDVPGHAGADAQSLPVIASSGVVEFDHVSFTYPGAPRPALHDVSFRLEPGKIVALVGPSGAGKSTIVRLLMRWHDPTAGAVRFDGDDLRTLRVEEFRERIALVSQDSPMVDRTIAENISYGCPNAPTEAVERAAHLADASGFIAEFPDGFKTSVGQRGRRLSGGQRQRIAIARAMFRDAPILVLDEPTSGLDATSADRIHEPIHRLIDNRATLLVSHNLRMVNEAHEILVLDGGRIVERGTHTELRAAGGLYETLYLASQPEQTPARAHREFVDSWERSIIDQFTQVMGGITHDHH
jgi:ATP-binding cassette, subfamily B, bacterial